MYKFRFDDGEEIEVDFDTMMSHVGGIIEVDGRTAKRVNEPSIERKSSKKELNLNNTPIVSDSLGVSRHSVDSARASVASNPELTGVEFKQDPTCETFYQAHFSCQSQKDKYLKHVNHRDFSSKNGAGNVLSGSHIEGAKEMILRNFGGEEQENSGIIVEQSSV